MTTTKKADSRKKSDSVSVCPLFSLPPLPPPPPFPAHIVLFRLIPRFSGASPEILPYFNYDAPEEVCCDGKSFDSPLQKRDIKQIFMLIVEHSGRLTPAAAFGCP